MSNSYPKQFIHFPRSWNEKWSNEGATDLEKAKIILYDFNRNDEADDNVKSALWNILKRAEWVVYFRNVTHLAIMIQDRVFRNQHSSFHSNWLLHRMRFILIKCLPSLPRTPDTDSVRNFFFDPSIPKHLGTAIPSADTITLELPKSMLKIVVIGGGPTGLLAAINLAERVRCRDLVQIHVYDKRWVQNNIGELEFTAYPEYQRRRDQVVTLQNHVTELLSRDTMRVLRYGLHKHGDERVWPESCNLQISKVEDALLKRAQDSMFDGIIHLHGADITDETTLLREAGDDFHLLLGTDGANSWVRRRYFSEEEEQCGRSFALGVALSRGDRGLPFSQALNIFLTLCQMRFLLNASDRYGTGYLNMLLTEQEYDECVSLNGTPADFRSPACIRTQGLVPDGFTKDQVFAPYDKDSSLWQSISDGLQLFGFHDTDVKSIVRIPINLIGVKTAAKRVALDSNSRRHVHCLVSLAGDSALTHHFWPGRGMNSGIKAAVAWSNQISDLVLGRDEGLVGLRLQALDPFLDFMKRLRIREHTQRSFVIQNTSGLPERMEEHMKQAHKLSEPDRKVDPALCDIVLRFAKRFEDTPRWPHKKLKGLSGMVMHILHQLSTRTKAEMYHSGPWPIAEMSADEVNPSPPRVQCLSQSKAADRTATSQNDPIRPSIRNYAIPSLFSDYEPFKLDLERFKSEIDKLQNLPKRSKATPRAEKATATEKKPLSRRLLILLLLYIGFKAAKCAVQSSFVSLLTGVVFTWIVLKLGARLYGELPSKKA